MYRHNREPKTRTRTNYAVAAATVILLLGIIGSLSVIRWRDNDARELDLRPYADFDHPARANVVLGSTEVLKGTGAYSPTVSMPDHSLSGRTHAAELADEKAILLDSPASSVTSLRAQSPSAEQLEQFSILANQ